jgi:ribonuclease J
VSVYGSELTLALARNRVDEAGMVDRAKFIPVADGERRRIGPCDVEFIPVTHSVPHAFAIAFHTPQGVILHSGDFKLDLHPVDGRRTDLARMGDWPRTEGVRLLLSDSTNAEEPGFTASESTVGETLRGCSGPSPEAAVHRGLLRQPHPPGPADHRRGHRQGRQGGHPRAVDGQERGAGPRLGHPPHPGPVPRRHRGVDKLDPGQVCVISTGSQGEPMSALSRLAIGENRWLQASARTTWW